MSLICECNFCAVFRDCPENHAELIIEHYPHRKCPNKVEMPRPDKELLKLLEKYHYREE